MSSTQLYLILGPADAGRRAVLADIIANGLEPAARPVLLTATSETPALPEEEQRLAGIENLQRANWTLAGARLVADFPADATHVFVLADGRANPVDQVEAFQAWLSGTGAELARVITVVDCRLGSEHPEVLRWYDACVHFSDVVLLNRREGVPNKWVSDFVARYRRQHFPCLIEFVKRGEVANPALILEPEARRMTQVFDEQESFAVAVTTGAIDEEDENEADDVDGELVEEDVAPVDPYLDRLAGSGRRTKEIPNIARILQARSRPAGEPQP